MVDPKQRFTDRVDDYVRYRPDYPEALFVELARVAGLGPGCVAAEVGSGTGIFARRLLDTGARVLAIEPNAAMRAAAERALSGHARFESRDGSAEATGLRSASVDLVAAAQAFHWFDPVKTRVELARVLKPGGRVALVWNQRKDTPFNAAYEAMLVRFAPDYANVREKDRAAEPRIRAFFAPATATFAAFANAQMLDAEGLRGRLTSSSYAPRRGDPRYDAIREELSALFAAHARGGHVVIDYETVLWHGALS